MANIIEMKENQWLSENINESYLKESVSNINRKVIEIININNQ